MLTRLNLGLPRCHGLLSGFRYCSIPISSMIWSNVSTGSQMSRISAIYTGNLPCFGLYCLWYCFMQEHYTTKECLFPLIFNGLRHSLLLVIGTASFFHSPKKIKTCVEKAVASRNSKGNVRLMFEDEAGFGRINKPKRCWCPKGVRPTVPCHHIREYRYAFGAVEPRTGENFFLTMPNCNTVCTNIFLQELSKQYPDDMILLVCDSAAWHKSKTLKVPTNIQLLSIPPYTPEMNPIEQIWKQLRSMGFRNEVFHSLAEVLNRLDETIDRLSNDMVKSITGRKWILECF